MNTICKSVLLLVVSVLIIACEPETYLFVNESPISFSESGGKVELNIVANKDWKVTSSAAWCIVSPSAGVGESTGSKIIIDCSENPNFDDRSCIITIVCAELAKSVTITQSKKQTLIISQKEYSLDENGGTITVEIQTNLSYNVEVTEGSSWISEISTKGLSSQSRKFEVKPNTTYEDRIGNIRFFNTASGLSEEVVIRQTEKKELIIEKTQYELTYESQLLNIAVLTNTNYEVIISNDCEEWIHKVETKGLNTETISLQILENEQIAREGVVYITSSSGIITLIISQADGTINNFIPDRAFLEYCLREFDTNHDNYLSYSEAKTVESIHVDTDIVGSMEGLQFFVGLKYLDCISYSSWGWNYDYYFEGIKGKLTSLDVSHNTSLVSLICACNHIKSLDLSNNTNLEDLDCHMNYLEYLNVSNCPHLRQLYCPCGWLDHLDVSNCTELEYINCSSNLLTSLDVYHNVKLTALRCDGNKLTRLNVSNNQLLEGLFCESNSLTQLDISKNKFLDRLHCYNNDIRVLDISKNTNLIRLNCSNNQLTTLDVSQNTALTELVCSYNQLTILDVSYNLSLASLDCTHNQLVTLDVMKNTALTSLSCDYNLLTTLDVSQNTALTKLTCYDETMTDLYLPIGQSFELQNWYSGTTVHYK